MSTHRKGHGEKQSEPEQQLITTDIVDNQLGLRKRMVPAVIDNNNTDRSGIVLTAKEKPNMEELIDVRSSSPKDAELEEPEGNFNERDLLLIPDSVKAESVAKLNGAGMNGDSKGLINEAFDREMVEFKTAATELSSSTEEISRAQVHIIPETSCSIAAQVFLPFLIAGCGTVFAGLVLDRVQHWRVFTELSEIFILVPALLGLKGNLEMTLASRLSTMANLGKMDTRADTLSHVSGNLALIQAQAAVVGFLASLFAIVLGWIPHGEFVFMHAVVLCASSLATASIASLVLSCVMILVVIVARHFHINPDNVATPIAASLGDLTTLGLLSLIATLFNDVKVSSSWLAPTVIIVFLLLIPLWVWLSARNEQTKQVLLHGWTPVIFSMLISSAGGFILDITVTKFRGIAVFQPVINGIGGNLVAVQASRISTSLHRESVLGVLPESSPKSCPNCVSSFLGSNIHSRSTRVLLALVVPGHLIFIFLIFLLKAGHTRITPVFIAIYLSAAFLQVALLLYICLWLVDFLWKRKIDPDNSAIPYLTAIGDLLGTAFLAVVFTILSFISEAESHVGE